MDASQILSQLRQERDRLDAAIAAVEALGTSSATPAPAKRKPGRPAKVSGGTTFNPGELSSKPKRKISAAGRARIAAAAKARWAKVRASK